MIATPEANTVGVISRRLGIPTHRVNYIVRTRGIRPASRAGMAHIYNEADVERIASEARRIDEDRGIDRRQLAGRETGR